jgi:AcrR family transcriptional regulator
MKEEHHLLDRVLSLFRRYGIRRVTMDDIATELGISKKTLYHHFRDKDDLISRVIDFDMDQSRIILEEVYQSGKGALEELFLVNQKIHKVRACYSPNFYYDLRRYSPEIYRRWISDKRQNMYGLITQNLQKGKQEGVYRQEIDESIIGRLYMARIEMLDSNEIIEEIDSRSSNFMKEVFSYHLHGICNQKGLEILSMFEDKQERTSS